MERATVGKLWESTKGCDVIESGQDQWMRWLKPADKFKSGRGDRGPRARTHFGILAMLGGRSPKIGKYGVITWIFVKLSV